MKTKTLSALAMAAALFSVMPHTAIAAPQDASERPEGGRDAGNRPPPPDLTEAAETLGISEEDLHAALRASGGPPPDLAKAAETLGVTEEELKAALPEPPQRGRRQ